MEQEPVKKLTRQEQDRERYLANRQKRIEDSKKYYQEHREAKLAYQKEYNKRKYANKTTE